MLPPTRPCRPPSPATLPPQAIDLLDEAGSRVRIATYNARRAGAGREGLEAAATSYMELEQVIATKNEAVQVRKEEAGKEKESRREGRHVRTTMLVEAAVSSQRAC